MGKFFYTFLFLSVMALQGATSIAEEFKTFETEYTTLYYKDEEEFRQFFWRISGEDVDIHVYPGFAKSRLDRIIEKVQAILDMYPRGFRVDIYVYPKYERGPIASYSEETKSIAAYADKITDAVLAHEISRAVIRSYFKTPPPEEVSEILCQYVDEHL